MSRELNKDAVKAIHEYYGCQGRKSPLWECEYSCSEFNYCQFGNGNNLSYNCGECGADEFYQGYIRAIKERRKQYE